MEQDNETLLTTLVDTLEKLTGKTRLELLQVIQNLNLLNKEQEQIIIKQLKTQKFKEGLELQVKELMGKMGYSRREALLLIKDVLDENQPILKSQE